MIALAGSFYRIVFEHLAAQVLQGAIHPEGRFHYDGQRALYASPSPETAAVAIARYLRPGDPERALVPLRLSGARIQDLRDPATCAALGIDPATPSVPWSRERSRGLPATSWRASDAVRASGADGMVYSSRTEPARWHLVLFRWNTAGAARIATQGTTRRWTPPAAF
jgi:RES domain-containing protein